MREDQQLRRPIPPRYNVVCHLLQRERIQRHKQRWMLPQRREATESEAGRDRRESATSNSRGQSFGEKNWWKRHVNRANMVLLPPAWDEQQPQLSAVETTTNCDSQVAQKRSFSRSNEVDQIALAEESRLSPLRSDTNPPNALREGSPAGAALLLHLWRDH